MENETFFNFEDVFSSHNYNSLKADVFSLGSLEAIESDHFKIDLFYERVLPSIAAPLLDGRYVCLFEDCARSKKLFKSKQTYFRHLQTIHRSEMPNNGSFLTPNNNSYAEQTCSFCGAVYWRKDKLRDHMRTNRRCRLLQQQHQQQLEQQGESRITNESTEECSVSGDLLNECDEMTTDNNKEIIASHKKGEEEEEDTQDLLVRLTQEKINLKDDHDDDDNLTLIDHHSPLILNEEIQHVELIDLETALVLVCDDETCSLDTRTESDNIDDQEKQVERTIENKDVKVEKQKIMIDDVEIKVNSCESILVCCGSKRKLQEEREENKDYDDGESAVKRVKKSEKDNDYDDDDDDSVLLEFLIQAGY